MSSSPLSRPVESGPAIIPLFVCAGCRPEPLGFATIALGDDLERMVACPLRDACAWFAGHDLGGTAQYDGQPEAARLAPAFRQTPYFSCPNFRDYDAVVR